MAAETLESRIVVTGMGCVTPLGLDVESSWINLIAGKSGIRDQVPAGYSQLGIHVTAPVSDFDLTTIDGFENYTPKQLRKMHRSAGFVLAASAEAIRQSGIIESVHNGSLDLRYAGISIGTGIGGAEVLSEARKQLDNGKRLAPSTILQVLPERVATIPSMHYGFQGPVQEVTGACATGNINIINAARMLECHDADVVIAGGTEAQITPESFGMFEGITALDKSTDPRLASRPFHEDANGFVIGEGAGVLVLETLAHARRRGAVVLAELIAYAQTSDAYHDTAPSGEGAERALRIVAANGQIDPTSRLYVNAHATGTKGDATELKAIGAALAEYNVVAISATKGATGHLLGAAGVWESIVCIRALQEDTLPPTLKLDKPIPEAASWNLVPNVSQRQVVDIAINNSFGFGGLNAVTAYARLQD